ncbi:MAG TPA: carbon storage regulator CsrA [Bacillota bacterium]|nr:carbon storage regulator CsrA [Bacillota bacterium]HOK68658.1 carbon storage regulator CsrA [Bacillota bacterium]HPP84770.1 carbon storage regulator CsrA [Bacillota bacterium]
MLVITRKVAESFIIGDNIRINILSVSGDKIKIGIEAPKDVKIMRTEVYETICNNIEAVTTEKLPDLELLKKKILKK